MSELTTVYHGDRIINVYRGRAYLHVSGYSLDRITHPATNADLTACFNEWAGRRDTFGFTSEPYTITALTVEDVDALIVETAIKRAERAARAFHITNALTDLLSERDEELVAS